MTWYDWLLAGALLGAGWFAYRTWKETRRDPRDRGQTYALGGGVDRPRRFARPGDRPTAARGDVIRRPETR